MRMLSDRTSDEDASTAPLLVTPAAATTAGGALLPAAGGDSAPDSNMVIVLAALLCMLLCGLALNSLLRCARYCSRSLAAGEPTTAAEMVVVEAPATVGLNKRELRKIPVVEYETKAGVPGTECAICLGEFADGEKVRVLPRCHHGFHVKCIDGWLAAHSSCPICRNSLLEDHGAGEATSVAGEAT